MKRYTKDISKFNYAASFKMFLSEKDKNVPFCFWMEGIEPHRPFVKGSGLRRGKSLDSVQVPPYLPDVRAVKSDFLDYAVAIDWFDKQVGRALHILKKQGLLKNTLIIVTADHGMQFPRAKAYSFDAGTHVPLAIMWKNGPIKNPGRTEDDLVSLIDIFPTLLQAAGLKNKAYNSEGKSWFPIFKEKTQNKPLHKYIYWGRERHTDARWLNFGYPQRATRSKEYLYIWNLKPKRRNAGAPKKFNKDDSLVWAYEDIDDSPTKSYMIERHSEVKRGEKKANINSVSDLSLFQMAFGKYPEEMLYNVQKDPYCLKNLVDNRKYKKIKTEVEAD